MLQLIPELQQGIVPVLTYDQVETQYRSEGIDIRDVEKSEGHFDRWHRRRGFPDQDEEGLHKGSSRIFMRKYQEDPEGEAAKPTYVDVWHWLITRFEMLAWKETSSQRTKDVPLIAGAFKAPNDPSEDDLAKARIRLEERIGSPLDDERWASAGREIVTRPGQDRASISMIERIVDRYGIELEVEGTLRKVMIMRLQVGR